MFIFDTTISRKHNNNSVWWCLAGAEGVVVGLFILNQRLAPPIIDTAIKIQALRANGWGKKNYEVVVTRYSHSHNYDVSECACECVLVIACCWCCGFFGFWSKCKLRQMQIRQ